MSNENPAAHNATPGLFNDLERYAGRTAIHASSGYQLSYDVMLSAGDAMAAAINGRRLVLVVCRNCPAAITGYVGLQRAGQVTMLVNHKTDPTALHGLIEAFRPAYLYLPESHAQTGLGSPVHHIDDYALLSTGLSVDYDMHGELAMLLGTSGSTGSPEYVRLSHCNLASNTEAIINCLDIEADDRAITTMPMSYSYGLSIINTHLAAGASIVANESSMMEKSYWTLLRDTRATTFGGVPYIYQMLTRLRFERMDLPHLRYITQAGGKLGTALSREFAEICLRRSIGFVTMYGQTEATARIAYVPPEQAIEKAGAIGVAIAGGHLWLAGPDGNDLPPGDEGEIVYEGANVSLGNARDRHQLAEADTHNGVLFTGDMGRRDADGYFFVVGRRSRFLKIFGNRVNLDEIEQLLAAAGIEAACGGIDDGLVVCATDNDSHALIRQQMGTRTQISAQGYRIVIVERIPRNDAGKVQYARLQELCT